MAAKKDKILKHCKNCDKEMLVFPYAVDRKNFCSRQCNCSYNMKGRTHMVGNKIWVGRKHKPESIEKMRLANLGKNLSPETEFKKGHESWNTGKVFYQILGDNHPTKRPEVALSISKAKKGKPNLLLRGDNNPRWRGGVTTENHKIRTSLEYKQWRTSVFERDEYTCQHCNQVGGKLQADHIKQFAFFPELRLDVDNGRTLCEKCHKKVPKITSNKNYIAA